MKIASKFTETLNYFAILLKNSDNLRAENFTRKTLFSIKSRLFYNLKFHKIYSLSKHCQSAFRIKTKFIVHLTLKQLFEKKTLQNSKRAQVT